MAIESMACGKFPRFYDAFTPVRLTGSVARGTCCTILPTIVGGSNPGGPPHGVDGHGIRAGRWVNFSALKSRQVGQFLSVDNIPFAGTRLPTWLRLGHAS